MLLRRDKKKGDREKAELLLLKTLSNDRQGLYYDIQYDFLASHPPVRFLEIYQLVQLLGSELGKCGWLPYIIDERGNKYRTLFM